MMKILLSGFLTLILFTFSCKKSQEEPQPAIISFKINGLLKENITADAHIVTERTLLEGELTEIYSRIGSQESIRLKIFFDERKALQTAFIIYSANVQDPNQYYTGVAQGVNMTIVGKRMKVSFSTTQLENSFLPSNPPTISEGNFEFNLHLK